jgi:hypothetical protein
MLVPLTQVIGTGYNAGLTATTLAFQPDAYAGGGFTSPSGRPVGGLKLGKDVAYRMVATAQNNRYRNGPPALGAASEIDPVMKDRSVPYMTEADQAARGYFAQVQAGWANKDCRPLLYAALAAAFLLFRRK